MLLGRIINAPLQRVPRMKTKSKKKEIVVAIDRIIEQDDSGPVADHTKYGSVYNYVIAEKGDVATVLSKNEDNVVCIFERTKMLVEIPRTCVTSHEA